MRVATITCMAALGAGLAVTLSACMPAVEAGRADYRDYCAGCHGPAGQGDGEIAADLPVPPADLTRIAARAGGVFDRVQVMSVIDGYTRRDQHGSSMPEMGPLLEEGRLVMLETGDGIVTPTPERLVHLAAYLESIQRP